jgi:propanediol dehydratase small subunit
LRIQTDNKRWDIDDLSAYTDVPLADQDPGMMDALSQASLEHLRLQSSLQEIFDLQGEHII